MPPHVLLQHPIHYWKLYVLSVGFHHGSVYGHVAYKVYSVMRIQWQLLLI